MFNIKQLIPNFLKKKQSIWWFVPKSWIVFAENPTMVLSYEEAEAYKEQKRIESEIKEKERIDRLTKKLEKCKFGQKVIITEWFYEWQIWKLKSKDQYRNIFDIESEEIWLIQDVYVWEFEIVEEKTIKKIKSKK